MDWIGLRQGELSSSILGNTRTVWVQPPAEEAASEDHGFLVFLDAEHYLVHVRAAKLVTRLQREGVLPPLVTAYVSSIDPTTRWTESFCNPAFVEFLAKELLPWLRAELRVGAGGKAALAGLSLTGLAAAHAAIATQGAFSRVLCQSGSFWWEEGWLMREVAARPPAAAKFFVSVGTRETDEDVDHGDGLIQRDSQLTANRKMRDALIGQGYRVDYEEFEGGHDIASWRADLPAGLTTLFREV